MQISVQRKSEALSGECRSFGFCSAVGRGTCKAEAPPKHYKHFRATLDNKLEVPPTSTVKYNRSKGFIFTKKAWQEQHKTLQKKPHRPLKGKHIWSRKYATLSVTLCVWVPDEPVRVIRRSQHGIGVLVLLPSVMWLWSELGNANTYHSIVESPPVHSLLYTRTREPVTALCSST